MVGYVLIVVGGIVRESGSGLGCGDHWPDCNGAVVPVFHFETAIEYTHRLIAALIVILTLGLVGLAVAAFRRHSQFVGLSILALGLVLVQALLGAVTVKFDLPPSIVMAHLGTAELYLAVLVILAVMAFSTYISAVAGSNRSEHQKRVGRLAIGAATAVFALLLSGAYTATSGAAYACPEWPLCNGHYLPTGFSAVDIQLLHRWLAVIAAVTVATLTVQAVRNRDEAPLTAGVAIATAVIMLIQIFVGAGNIWFKLAPTVGVVHLAVATIIWVLLIVVVVLEHLAPAISPSHEGATDRLVQHAAHEFPAG